MVKVVEKLKAARSSEREEGPRCTGKEQFPPARKRRRESVPVVVEAAADEPRPGAGEPQPLAAAPTRRAHNVAEGGRRE